MIAGKSFGGKEGRRIEKKAPKQQQQQVDIGVAARCISHCARSSQTRDAVQKGAVVIMLKSYLFILMDLRNADVHSFSKILMLAQHLFTESMY